MGKVREEIKKCRHTDLTVLETVQLCLKSGPKDEINGNRDS